MTRRAPARPTSTSSSRAVSPPGANVVVYQAPNTDPGFADAFFTAGSQDVAGSVSVSWGEPETYLQEMVAAGEETTEHNAAFDEAFLELAAQGQAVFDATGDNGAYDAQEDPTPNTNLSIDSNSDSPYITAAGGTSLPLSVTIAGTNNGNGTQDNNGSETVTLTQQRAWGWDYTWNAGADTTPESLSDSAEANVAVLSHASGYQFDPGGHVSASGVPRGYFLAVLCRGVMGRDVQQSHVGRDLLDRLVVQIGRLQNSGAVAARRLPCLGARLRVPSGTWRTNHGIDTQGLLEQVRALRAQRYTPAEIARSLAITKGEAARLVRVVAIESGTGTAGAGEAREGTRCWISPGWRHGLRIEGHDDWPDDAGALSEAGDSGVALVVVAKPDGYDRLAMCSYLVDTWCLGVKNAMGPKRMGRRELEALRRQCYAPWQSHGIPIPLEFARHLVLGAVEFALRLGFDAHPDFVRARSLLGSWEGPSAITFGLDGKPHYVNGPYEDPQRVLATLERAVGRGGFHYTVSLGEADDLGHGYRYSAVLTDRDDHLSDAA